MIDPVQLRVQLATLTSRANEQADAERWAAGEMFSIPDELLPTVPEGARAALVRLANMAQSIGPRIVTTIKFGTLGDINWGGDNTAMDELLREQDLDAFLDEVLEQALSSGVIVGITRRDPETQQARIEPLVGYSEPIYSKDSPTRITGFIHAWLEIFEDNKTPTWAVRVYDLGERSMTEWRNLSEPRKALTTDAYAMIEPSAEYPQGAPLPRFAVVERGPDRLPRGLIKRNLPIIRSDWSSQIRGDRAEENTAFPQLKIRGEAEDGTTERSSNHIIRLMENGDAGFILPGDLSQIHAHHNRKLERIREDCSMPGGFLGSQTPSGEALREANAKFINMCKWLAKRLTKVMNELVKDLAEAEGYNEPPLVSVIINREFEKANEIGQIIQLYEKGLLEHGAAVRAISVYVPTWEDADVEAYIEAEAAFTSPPAMPPPGTLEVADA